MVPLIGMQEAKMDFSGKAELVQMLLETGTINFDEECRLGGTWLHNVTSNGHEASVRLLLEMGANIEAEGEKERTVLHVAVKHRSLGRIQLFLDKSANIEVRNKDG